MQDRFFGGQDVYTGDLAERRPTASPRQQLAEAARTVLPEGVEARTGDEVVETNKKALDQILGFITTFLLVFAGVSLVVGIFLIINTFSILVAQRSRELALLRALGASRRQVNRSVLARGRRSWGCSGPTVGLGLGYLLALGLRWLFGTFGLDLSQARLPDDARPRSSPATSWASS